ncbi:MAG TPA: YjbQ family protein [Chthoniobacterales bacterium]|nr:YjbQ family protein [Chthoniobacterales bacterium]
MADQKSEISRLRRGYRTRTGETVPIVDGKMQLGTWQGIFLFEHRRAAHRRKVSVTIIGE